MDIRSKLINTFTWFIGLFNRGNRRAIRQYGLQHEMYPYMPHTKSYDIMANPSFGSSIFKNAKS